MALDSVKLINEDVESGGKEQSEDEIENDFLYKNNVHNATVNIRLGFLRKVYGLLSVQLLITIAVGTVFMAFEPLKTFVRENSWTLLLSFSMTIATLFTLYVKRKDHPANLILLTLFTLTKAYTIAIVVSMYDAVTVLEALLITMTVMIGLTIYTFQSKRDLSISSSGLFIGLWILLFGGLIQIFLQSTIMELMLGVGGAALMSLFIIFDTRLIMHTLSPEEYILATINIYLDIINLFLYILRIFQASK